MDDKVKDGMFDDEGQIFPETESRRLNERFAPLMPRAVTVETMRAIEQTLREPARPRVPLLAEREHTHGNFDNTARIAQQLKAVMHDTPNWSNLTHVQNETLEAVQVKVARILAGDPNHKDHWSDIAGAAHLAEERL